MKTVRIYTDGACSGNQNENNIGGWGAILEYNNQSKEVYGGEANTTNNRMELMALIEALKVLKSSELALEIYSDSAYLVNCFQQGWYQKWRLNGWKNSQKEPVENQDLWQDLIQQIEAFPKVLFFNIKGHLDLNKQSELAKWHKKFNEKHQLNISSADFIKLVKMNHKADELANVGIDSIRGKTS